jgi:proteasome lid subunit RPN8/RPN11
VTGRGPAVVVRKGVVEALVAHARDEAPGECCGLLIGHRGAIVRAVRARNARPGPRTYLIDPRDHFAAIRSARSEGMDIVGFYHSHPASAPEPSPTDRAEAVAGDHYYLIVTPDEAAGGPVVAAYWLLDGNFRAVDLVAVG